jgi:endonuclease V-like protein UPF0215 family
MEREDKVVDAFDIRRITKRTRLPLICVYKSPADYPGKYIARLWDVDIPTELIAKADTLEEIRKAIPAEMVNLGREPEDDPVIIETWI